MRTLTVIGLIVALLNCSLLIASGQECPEQCKCSARSLRCLRAGLTSMPNRISSKFALLDLRNNSISSIPLKALDGLSRLKILLLNNNKISVIFENTFKDSAGVESLFLGHNAIIELKKNSLIGLEKMRVLRLNDNQINYIADGAFAECVSLEKIYLANNLLTTIQPNVGLAAMKKLSLLNLDQNPIKCSCAIHSLTFAARTEVFELSGQCSSPSSLRAKSLSRLTIDELDCSAPTVFRGPVVKNKLELEQFATLTCELNGNPKPTILWTRDGDAIDENSNSSEILKHGRVLKVQVNLDTIGSYRCAGINIVGQVTSEAAEVRVEKKSANSSKKSEHLKVESSNNEKKDAIRQVIGTSIVIDCDSNQPNWRLNSKQIKFEDERLQLLANHSLEIRTVLPADSGIYTCSGSTVATNVEVLVPPVFLSSPDTLVLVAAEKPLRLVCEASGNPSPTITWNRLSITKSSEVSTGEKFSIKAVKASDEAQYECIATNEVGVAIKNFQVSVIGGQFDENAVTDSVLLRRRSGGIALIEQNSITQRDLKDAAAEAKMAVDEAIARTLAKRQSSTNIVRGRLMKFGTRRFDDQESAEAAKSMEIFQRSIEVLKRKAEAASASGHKLNSSSLKEFDYSTGLSSNQMNMLATLSGCEGGLRNLNVRSSLNRVDIRSVDCYSCANKKWRTFDGTCNNQANSSWGTSLSVFRRLIPAQYHDGVFTPRGWQGGKLYNGFRLPSARKVSLTLSTRTPEPDATHSHMLMQWGQWIDHDLGHTLSSVSVNPYSGVAMDCSKTCDHVEPCFSVPLEPDDPRRVRRHLAGRPMSATTNGCIEVIRSAAFCGSGLTSVVNGVLFSREQVNQITAYIDASMVYGSNEVQARELRQRGLRDDGLMAISKGAAGPDGPDYLPHDDMRRPAIDCQQEPGNSDQPCFLAGDNRANEQLALTAMHTLFVREHNRIARELKTFNQIWSSERLFQETRRIVGALMQKITLKDWLPKVIGQQEMSTRVGSYRGYNSSVDASVSNSFTTAAFRFGHTLVRPFLSRLNASNMPLEQFKSELPLFESFFAPHRILNEGGLDPIMRGLVGTSMKMVRPDQVISSQLTEHLFELSRDVSLDLASLNIQRGRDHALPGYGDWRKFCGLPVANTFDQLSNEMRDSKVRAKLAALYGHPANIDLWVAGASENPVSGGKVGPTFACIIADQFRRARDGDRFWYEASGVFSREQKVEIDKWTLSSVVCANGDDVRNMPRDAFNFENVRSWTDCAAIPRMNLSAWSLLGEEDCNTLF